MTDIYLSASTDAVDAALITKRDALVSLSNENSMSLSQIAAIGDSQNDLPFLEIEGIGLVGAPSNAQKLVKNRLKYKNNYQPIKGSVFEGFYEFYMHAYELGIKYIFADRDGVLIWKDSEEKHAQYLKKLLINPDFPKFPKIYVLTGSSVEQNQSFISQFDLNNSNSAHVEIRNNPYTILAENGSIFMNILTGECKEAPSIAVNSKILKTLNSYKEDAVEEISKDILPKYNLSYSFDHDDQVKKIYIPNKKYMLTLNIPKYFDNGDDYRASRLSDELRESIVHTLEKVAKKHKFNVCFL